MRKRPLRQQRLILSSKTKKPRQPCPDDDMEVDALLEMPDDPDAAMAWLEQLAARQGAPLEELPSITEASTFETPRQR